MKSTGYFVLLFFLTGLFSIQAGVSPSSATWTMYKVLLYESADCSGTPQTLFDNSDGESSNFVENPTIGTASITDGTYNCVAIKISEAVTYIPAEDEGAECAAGSSYTIGVCPSGFSGTDADDGTTISCTDDTSDQVWIYLSTWSASVAGGDNQTNNAFIPPTSDDDADRGIKLASALTVSGDTTGTFVIDTSGSISSGITSDDGSASCGMDQPNFSFE
jgi:hypothetical protein